MADGKVVIQADIDTKSFDSQIDYIETQLEEIEKQLKEADMGYDVGDVRKLEAHYEKLKNQLIELKRRKEDFNNTPIDNGDVEKEVNNIGKGLTKITKKVAKWGLAVFGVRSAYMFVRQAVSTLASGNEQLAADVDYIRYAIASTLQPLIEKLVEWAYKLLSYLGYIVKAWFGVNIFKNANKGLQQTTKSARELKKELAGFDEMNILGSNNTADSGSSLLPSVDLSNIDSLKVPGWVQWIADNKDLLLMLGGVLVTAFGISSISKILSNIAMLFGASGGMGLIGLSEMLLAIATPVLIYFVAKGLKEIIDEMNLFNDAVDRNNELIKASNDAQKEMIDTIIERTKAGQISDEQVKTSIAGLEKDMEATQAMTESLQDQRDITSILSDEYWELRDQQKSLRDATMENTKAYEELVNANKLTDSQQENYIETLKETIDKLRDTGIDVTDLMKRYEELSGKKYVIEVDSNTSRAEGALSRLKSMFSSIFGIFAGGGGGGKGFAKGGIVYHSLPKLAPGGIINQPGRGVPLGSAIGGERGAEGVIPLTDSQQMALLGEAIGKYITINASITNTMNGRVISRELQKVQNESDFAYNR